ncbi:leucine rich repeat domain containing protein [Acanthamoeba castellanii str. Neff]|uniref:Leucine rich repeat domain containing protein n=1 Tax=Acanthamoeba castellanii (strain ATCC 30010 / Neff) TaxID=1257118 RepID=L8HIE3_ACACF|nr:leucine rich repeat domain containing protein [Acanthamoeba castellanii str. Neff]ELR24975.1 leucine rich repeat domain containing protein [Acanthamoeba castellanii str. Neff]
MERSALDPAARTSRAEEERRQLVDDARRRAADKQRLMRRTVRPTPTLGTPPSIPAPSTATSPLPSPTSSSLSSSLPPSHTPAAYAPPLPLPLSSSSPSSSSSSSVETVETAPSTGSVTSQGEENGGDLVPGTGERDGAEQPTPWPPIPVASSTQPEPSFEYCTAAAHELLPADLGALPVPPTPTQLLPELVVELDEVGAERVEQTARVAGDGAAVAIGVDAGDDDALRFAEQQQQQQQQEEGEAEFAVEVEVEDEAVSGGSGWAVPMDDLSLAALPPPPLPPSSPVADDSVSLPSLPSLSSPSSPKPSSSATALPLASLGSPPGQASSLASPSPLSLLERDASPPQSPLSRSTSTSPTPLLRPTSPSSSSPPASFTPVRFPASQAVSIPGSSSPSTARGHRMSASSVSPSLPSPSSLSPADSPRGGWTASPGASPTSSPVSGKRSAALGSFRSASTSRLPTTGGEGQLKPLPPPEARSTTLTTAQPSKSSSPALTSSVSASSSSSLAGQAAIGALGSSASHGATPETKRRWARESEAANSLEQVASRYRAMASDSLRSQLSLLPAVNDRRHDREKMNDMKRQLDQLEERYKDQQPPAQEGGRKSVLGSIIASRKFAPAPNKEVRQQVAEAPVTPESVRREGGGLVGPQGALLPRESVKRMLALLRAHRTKLVQGKDLVTWELYLEYYLKGEGQSNHAAHATTSWAAQFGSSSDSRLSTSISPSARASFIAKTKKQAEEKEKARERARNRERRQEQKFLQQWNDQAFKLAPSTSAAEVAQHLEQIYSLPAKRLSLMANALRNEGVWHGFSASTPSLANLQFTCQTLVLSLNELTQVPVEVCRLVNLRHLYVSFNRLTSLPTEIGCLKHLTVLEARGNDIAAVPWSLYELTSLRKLDLSQNRISRLHSSLGNLAQLNSLNLAYNQLAALPYEIGALDDLKELNLRENQLSWLPESIGFLFSLAKLDIEQNKPSPHMTTYLQILAVAAPRAAPADPAFVSTAPPAPQALVKHFWEMLASHWSPSRSKVYVLGDGAISLNYVWSRKDVPDSEPAQRLVQARIETAWIQERPQPAEGHLH